MSRGAGRLFSRVLAGARRDAPDGASSTTAHAGLRRRRRIRVVVGVLVVALLGPARPFVLTAVNNRTTPEHAAAGLGVDGKPSAGSWKVEVHLPDEVEPSADAKYTVAPPSATKRHALIIGINHARGGTPLPGSVTDAKNMRDALLMYGFKSKNITVLTEGKATREAIRNGITSLAQRTPSKGIAVFAVTTHTRRRGGQNELLTADGLRISASELASRLGAVKARMWVALPTCYAAGYAKSGIVGKNRLATFASAADRESYQLGDAGSDLIRNMARKAMLEKRAPGSVEEAFRYAARAIERDTPDSAPSMSDGIRGDLVLGTVPDGPPGPSGDSSPPHHWSYEADVQAQEPVFRPGPGYEEDDEPTPPSDGSQSGVGVCGSFQARCNH